VACGRTITLGFTNASGPQRLALEPWMAYQFGEKEGVVELRAIGLAGNSPGVADVPERVEAVKPLTVPLKLLVDDADRRTKANWSAALAKRLGKANAVLSRAASVTFEIVDTAEWKANPNSNDLKGLTADFEAQVKPEPAALALGYTSRALTPVNNLREVELFALARPALYPHRVIREGEPRTEPERVEVLVAQLARHLGAVASPDGFSALRPRLGDGKAMLAKFEIGIDPLNTLAMNIWADGLRRGVTKIGEFRLETQVRLARIYATLNMALPEEPLSEDVQALFERAGLRAVAPVAPVAPAVAGNAPPAKEPAKPALDRALKPDEEATRKVVRAIVVKAEENARKPAGERVKGDALSELYFRAAADVAVTLEPKLRKAAFLYGIGIGLDDSTIMRDKLKDFCIAVENDEERRQRLAVLGNPTMRFRRDSCQHFVISAALTEFGGAFVAEQVGLLKEQKDMQGSSGFSFADLCADFAGIELALFVKASGENLAKLRDKFSVADYLPKLDDLPDGLSKEKFKLQYGDTGDARFKSLYEDVKKRVKDLPAHQKR
jgi:hypothetical protein